MEFGWITRSFVLFGLSLFQNKINKKKKKKTVLLAISTRTIFRIFNSSGVNPTG
jgi:hypothetical protein